MHVLCMYFQIDLIFILCYIPERNIVLFTPPHLFDYILVISQINIFLKLFLNDYDNKKNNTWYFSMFNQNNKCGTSPNNDNTAR